MATVLTIAGSDSGGGAGIQADLKTLAARGVYGTSAITALTAQNTRAVTRVEVMPPDVVRAQIDAVASDIAIDAVRTGMLADAAIVETVADAIEHWKLPRLVVDPVMISKSGAQLLADKAVATVVERLLPLAAVVTPNRPEAEALSGRPVRTLDEARDAARQLCERGARAVVVKGGHFEGATLVNLLFDGHDFTEFATIRLAVRHTHGTGCTFASAIAADLARGDSLADAVRSATEYVAGAMAHGLSIGHGYGPLDHFWQSRTMSPDDHRSRRSSLSPRTANRER
jgi:hydroxymethylpyrimidine/phosphomethylpyrimidine kinase